MLRLQNISKQFAGVKALQHVSLQIQPGEVHALCGENGAGKSTLMNIIMGNLQPDAGTLFWDENPVTIPDVLAAQALGISIVYQERSLADALSIAENIFPVRMPLTKRGLIDYPALYKKAGALLQELGLTQLSPKTNVHALSVAQKQMVEIAKAIAQESALLILDEPTASITHAETEILFQIIRQLKQKGVGIIYISHRMAEIKKLADTMTVLKDGKLVGTVGRDTPTEQIIRMMVGRALETVTEDSHANATVKLDVQNISGAGFKNISFQLHEGEILGLAGLQGSGRSALMRALFGDAAIYSGTVLKDGKPIKAAHPANALLHRIVYVPEDRKTEGLFLEKSIAENLISMRLNGGFYRKVAVDEESKTLCADYNIRMQSITQHVRRLSGGNQQKVLLAKCLALQPDVLIVNEPTHGVDVGSKAEIYGLLKKLTAGGKSILLISSELPELLLLSDRIAVMHEGKLNAIINRNDATEESITALASGVTTS